MKEKKGKTEIDEQSENVQEWNESGANPDEQKHNEEIQQLILKVQELSGLYQSALNEKISLMNTVVQLNEQIQSMTKQNLESKPTLIIFGETEDTTFEIPFHVPSSFVRVKILELQEKYDEAILAVNKKFPEIESIKGKTQFELECDAKLIWTKFQKEHTLVLNDYIISWFKAIINPKGLLSELQALIAKPNTDYFWQGQNFGEMEKAVYSFRFLAKV